MKLTLTHDYPTASPEAVWELCTSYAALHEVCAPLVTFEGVPHEGHVREGDHIETDVRLFGRLPAQPYTMDVVSCDPAAREFRSSERGAGVSRWNHHLRVIPLTIETGQGAQIHEDIDIDAGLMTPLMWLWGRTLYRHRHKKRRALLQGTPSLS